MGEGGGKRKDRGGGRQNTKRKGERIKVQLHPSDLLLKVWGFQG